MKYDFDRAADRHNVGAYKWENIPASMGPGSEDVIPLFVADMDFSIMPEISEAICALAKKGVYGYTVPTERYYGAVKKWMLTRHRWRYAKNGYLYRRA